MSTFETIFVTEIADNQSKETRTVESLFSVIDQPSYSGYITGFIGIHQPITTIASSTTVNISKGDFLFRDIADPLNPVFSLEVVEDLNGYTPNHLNGAVTTSYVYADLQNMVYLDTDFLPSQAPDHFSYIGNIDYSTTTTLHDTILSVNIFINTAYSVSDTSLRLLNNAGIYNLYGCVYGAGGGLTLAHTEGSGVRMGANLVNDISRPDTPISPTDSISAVFRGYVNDVGVLVFDFSPDSVDSSNWAKDGVLTSTNSAKFTVQYLYHFYGSDVVFIYLGQQEYNSIDTAIDSVTPLGSVLEDPITKEAQLRAAIVVKGNTIDLTNLAEARFIEL